MRYRDRQPTGEIPEVNLVPLMDVLMSVLTFFIISSMTLTGYNVKGVDTPGAGAGFEETKEKNPFVIGLDKEKQLVLDGEVVDRSTLEQQMLAYIEENPEGSVIVKADRSLPYSDVKKLLKEMGEIGGSRVSLGIQRN